MIAGLTLASFGAADLVLSGAAAAIAGLAIYVWFWRCYALAGCLTRGATCALFTLVIQLAQLAVGVFDQPRGSLRRVLGRAGWAGVAQPFRERLVGEEPLERRGDLRGIARLDEQPRSPTTSAVDVPLEVTTASLAPWLRQPESQSLRAGWESEP